MLDLISPDWGKYGGLIGMVIGSVLMILAILVIRVMPGMRKNEADRDDHWFQTMLDSFKEQARLEREQCDRHHTANLELTRQSLETRAVQHVENMAAHRATAHAIRDLAQTFTIGRRNNGGIVQ